MSSQPTRAPWDTEDGKPVYLFAASGGVLEAMAEELREQQLTNARKLYEISADALDELPPGTRFLVREPRASVADLLRLLEG